MLFNTLLFHVFTQHVQSYQGLLLDLLARIANDVINETSYDDLVVDQYFGGEVFTQQTDHFDGGASDLFQLGLQTLLDIAHHTIEVFPERLGTSFHNPPEDEVAGHHLIVVSIRVVNQLLNNAHCFGVHFLPGQVVADSFDQVYSDVLDCLLVVFQVLLLHRLADNEGHVLKHLLYHLLGPDLLLVFYESKDEVDDLLLQVETYVSTKQHFGRLDDVEDTSQLFVQNVGGRDYIAHGFQ